jgi:hypothetical protein
MEQENSGEIVNCSNVNMLSSLELDLGRDDDYYGGSTCSKACACNEAMISAVRFTDVSVPAELGGVPVYIKNAYIEFTAREASENSWDAAMTLRIAADAYDSSPALSTALYDISSRMDTIANVNWNVPQGEWTVGQTYRSPDIAPIVQELIDRPGWQVGNAMLFKIYPGSAAEGRPVHSFDSNAALAPRLVIEWTVH